SRRYIMCIMLSMKGKLAEVWKTQSYTGHHGPVYRLSASNSCDFFSGGSDGFLVSWKCGCDVGKALLKFNSPIFSLTSGPSETYIGTFDGKIFGSRGTNISQHQGPVFALIQNKNILVACGSKGEIGMYDLESLSTVKRFFLCENNLRCLKLHPNLPLLLAAGSDGKIYVLDFYDLQELDVIEPGGASIFALEFSSDGTYIYSAGRDAHIKVIDFKTGCRLFDIPAHFFSINDLKLIYGGRYLGSASMDKTIRIWRTDDMKLIKVIDKARNDGHTSSVNALLWNTENETLISAGDDGKIFEWKIEPLC
ncbi:MAG: WD40 repeat domain-containing protein, partial [Bacteroidia bacterium]|nr:WD40 repeat domain-containing protein [Bacteroidia bacterium]